MDGFQNFVPPCDLKGQKQSYCFFACFYEITYVRILKICSVISYGHKAAPKTPLEAGFGIFFFF
jgi:hypothetical protein